MKEKLLLLFFSAFVVRLISLTQSLWLDEATTARVAHLSYSQILTIFSPTDFHPPFYYIFMKAWTGVFGFSEISLRMPSVIFSLLTGYVVYLIGKRLKNETTGLWSAMFFLFNPLIVYYSQEARMYMQAIFLLTLSLFFFLNIEKKLQFSINFLLFNLFCILSFYTFYGSVFLIATFYLYFLLKRQYRLFFLSALCFLLSAVFLVPLLYQQIKHAHESLGVVVNWGQVLGPVNLKNLLLIPLKFSVGRISFEPKTLYYVIGGIWTGVIILGVISGIRKFGAILLTVPILLGVLFSFFTPLLQYFRFLYLIPVMSLLLAMGIGGSEEIREIRGIREIGGIGVVGGFVILSLIYLIFPKFHREDWRSLTKSIPYNIPVYMIYSSSDPLVYYRPDIKVNQLITIGRDRLHGRIFVIPYTADIYGFDYREILTAKKFLLKKTYHYRGLSSEVWSR